MKKFFKAILIIFILSIFILSVNLCYYTFVGQHKSVEKLSNNIELNLYECCSIYQMHATMCILGYPIAPEAARECFYLHFTKRDTVHFHKFDFSKSEKLKKAYQELKDKPYGSSIRISWNGNKDYSPFSGEHRLAIATNPCTLTKVSHYYYDYLDNGDWYTITTSTQYPTHSRTEFNFKKFKIIVNEGLYRYLQDKGWLKKYIAVYDIVI